MGWAGTGQGGSKKSKLIPVLAPLQGGKNPLEVKWGGAGQVGRGKIGIPYTCSNYLFIH